MSSFSRCTNAATHSFQATGVAAPKNPIVGSFADCCARVASGHVAAEPATTLMKSRRRIAIPSLRTTPTPSTITAGICDWWNRVQESVCAVAILSRSCPLWVISGHWSTSASCPLYPQKRTMELNREMSALCQKRTYAMQQRDRYSITLSARVSILWGTDRPISSAVCLLMTSSKLVGCSIGSSPGGVACKSLETNPANRR